MTFVSCGLKQLRILSLGLASCPCVVFLGKEILRVFHLSEPCSVVYRVLVMLNTIPGTTCKYYMKHQRQCLIRIYKFTEKRVENTTCSGVFWTKFEMFG